MGKGRISQCDVLINNMYDVNNGTYNTSKVGSLMAANSPQNRRFRDTLSPVRDENGILSRNSLGQPQVKVQFQKARTRTVFRSPTCDGTAADVPSEVSFTMTKYAQMEPIEISGIHFNQLCNEAFDNLEMGPGNKIIGIKKGVKDTRWLSWLKEQMGQYINDMLETVNQDCLAAFLAGVGTNAKYGNATAQSVPLFDIDGKQVNPLFYDEMGDIEKINDVCGTPIIIGGLNIDRLRRKLDIGCCSDIGFNYAEMGNKLMFEHYYDPLVDTVLGANQFLICYPDSIAFVSYPRYEYLQIANGNSNEHGNSQFGVLSLSELSCMPGDRIMDIDIKMRYNDCNPAKGNEPYWTIIPSISYEPFAKPVGMNYASGPLQNVNGIMRYIGINA
jgi:hypothetical protein